MDMYRVVQHLVREPWKSQEAGEGAGAGFNIYRLVQQLVMEPWKSQGAKLGAGAG